MISNCLVENQVRPFAVGKRNWLFVGNEKSAKNAALLYSLIQSCEMNDIDTRKYPYVPLGSISILTFLFRSTLFIGSPLMFRFRPPTKKLPISCKERFILSPEECVKYGISDEII